MGPTPKIGNFGVTKNAHCDFPIADIDLKTYMHNEEIWPIIPKKNSIRYV